jgi:hypothetical protein
MPFLSILKDDPKYIHESINFEVMNALRELVDLHLQNFSGAHRTELDRVLDAFFYKQLPREVLQMASQDSGSLNLEIKVQTLDSQMEEYLRAQAERERSNGNYDVERGLSGRVAEDTRHTTRNLITEQPNKPAQVLAKAGKTNARIMTGTFKDAFHYKNPSNGGSKSDCARFPGNSG